MRLIAGLLPAVLIAAPAWAAGEKLPKAPAYVLEADRQAAAGRAGQIEIAQTEIGSAIELGRVAQDYYGGGALDYWWFSQYDNKADILGALAWREAEQKVGPVRRATAGFDLEGLSLATVRAGLAASSWFKAEPLEINRRPSPGSRLDFADVAPTGQVAFVSIYSFLSPDFNQVEVLVDITIGQKTKAKKKPKIIFFHRMASVVQLQKTSFDSGANIRAWSANDGKRTREALQLAMTRMQAMIPQALDMSQAEALRLAPPKPVPGQEMAQVAGRYGPVVDRDRNGPGSLTIWSKGLVSVQKLPE